MNPEFQALMRSPAYRPPAYILALVKRDLADAEAALARVLAGLRKLEGWLS